MAWGNSTPPPPTQSALSKVAPLLIFFALVGIIAAVLLQVAKTASDIADNAGKKLEKKNVVITKDGVKVGVKEIRNENYVDKTQRCVLREGLPPSPSLPLASPRVRSALRSRFGLEFGLLMRGDELLQCPGQGMESLDMASLQVPFLEPASAAVGATEIVSVLNMSCLGQPRK
jgi:hypothetical protein